MTPRRRLTCAVAAAIVLLIAGGSLGIATEVPFLAGRVNDNAGLLTAATSADLEAMLKAHEDSTSNQVVVLTVQTLEGEEIEPFAIRVAETWKLGRKEKDNGVLLVVAKEERKVRIEVGSGLEGDLTDLTCGRIIRHEIVPRFKEGDYDGGIRAGVESILAAIKGAYTAGEETAEDDPFGDVVFSLIFLGFFLLIVSPFTIAAVVSEGFASWFLYVFLIPFWAVFPMVSIGALPGGMLLASYLIGFPIAKYLLAKTPKGKTLASKWAKAMRSSSGGGGSRRWGGGGSSGSSWSSGGGGSSFSGGGGSFSGGGASGSW